VNFTFAFRPWAAASLVLGLITAGHNASAEYPEKPVRFIVGSAAGGAGDVLSRVIGAEFAQRTGQPFIVENKPGAAGAIGYDAVAKAAPDGYTLGLASLSTFVVGALAAKHVPYKTEQDFSPVAKLFTQPNILAVNPKLPVRTVKDLINYAKQHPNDVFYGSTGNGTSLHVLTEVLRQTTDISITHVPYKSSPAAESDLAAGQIQMMISNFTSLEPQIRAGRVRALAITSPTRSPLLPNVPTAAEAGIPAVEMVTWAGVVGPAKMPAEVIRKLNTELNAIISDPKVVKQFQALGSDAAPQSVSQFDDLIKAENARWGKVIKDANITAE
jgi:tripartite-type tricarboxylate transporter receptor subunit TctC